MRACALALSHINDAGFWMFTKLAGLDAAAGLRTWTVLPTVMGCAGFALTAALWPLVRPGMSTHGTALPSLDRPERASR
jgi:GntP family gluconate:H+ symporter